MNELRAKRVESESGARTHRMPYYSKMGCVSLLSIYIYLLLLPCFPQV